MLCCTIHVFIFLVWGACLQSRGQLLSKHLTQLTPNYKVTKENDMLLLGLFLVTLWAQSWPWTALDHMAVRGYRISFPTYTSPWEGRFGTAKEDPRVFSSTTADWNCILSFSFLREIVSKHCLNSHFKNNYYRFKTFIMLSLEPGKGYSCGTSGHKQERIIRN